jgi:hypothetical protein
MATISTDDGVFRVGYEALAEDGAKRHFQNQYTADAHVIIERQLDPLSLAQRWREERQRRTAALDPAVRHGIYARITSPGLLAFLDQSEAEDHMFLNWRQASSVAYSRAAIGTPQFLEAGREARPTISDILDHDGYLAFAWVRTSGTTHDLLFTRVKMADGAVAEHVVAHDIPFTTCVSAANISASVIVVRHTAMLRDGADADVVPYFLDIETVI